MEKGSDKMEHSFSGFMVRRWARVVTLMDLSVRVWWREGISFISKVFYKRNSCKKISVMRKTTLFLSGLQLICTYKIQ